jgi:lysylphosphatidylglycerol synthetase-like protein (DUF2156 family)
MAPHPLLASAIIDKLKRAGVSYGGSSSGVGDSGTQIASIIGTIISVALSLLGIVFLTLLVYAGYVYMMAGGDETKVERAKHTIVRSIIGLTIVLCAYAIAKFVVPALLCATGAGSYCPPS